MNNRRRITIITISVVAGTMLSFLLFKMRRGGGDLTAGDLSTLLTNLFFSLAIILGVGFLFLWRKKK